VRGAVRQIAVAFTTGAVVALVLDAALQLAVRSIRITGGMMRPWWVQAMEHGVWVGVGLVLWLASPLVASWLDEAVERARLSRRAIWDLIGTGFLVLPIAHLLGQWIALAVQFTLFGTWMAEGRIFLSTAYYGNVLLAIAPWMGAGAVLRACARHGVSD
jgi:hypothetical protein